MFIIQNYVVYFTPLMNDMEVQFVEMDYEQSCEYMIPEYYNYYKPEN